MKLIKASESHSKELIEYYSSVHVSSTTDFQIERQGSFFNQYKLLSDDHVTYILRDEKDHKINATATLVFKRGWINGEEQTIGFATDLRVTPNRKAIVSWAQYFLPLLREEKNKRNCKYVFSVVSDLQSQAYNAFVRPRSKRKNMPRYFLFNRFDVVGLHGMYPFSPKPLKTLYTSRATQSDLEPLAYYVASKMKERPLYFDNSPEDFKNNLLRWKNLDPNDFLISKDSYGNIVGCVGLWKPDKTEKYKINRYSDQQMAFKEALTFFSYFKMTRRPADEGHHLNMYQLSYLLADNPDIFYSILVRAYKETAKEKAFLMYPRFHGNLQYAPPKAFFKSSFGCGLYCVLDPEDPVPEFIKPKLFNKPPHFEIAFI